MFKLKNRKGRKGFTLVELAVVIVIIGVLASFGVPKFMQSVERSKAAEAFNFLSALQAAEERYQALTGAYTDVWTNLDISWKVDAAGTGPALQYFTYSKPTLTAATAVDGTVPNAWSCTLSRSGQAGNYGTYSVVYTNNGFDMGVLTAPAVAASTIDPAISPISFTAP